MAHYRYTGSRQFLDCMIKVGDSSGMVGQLLTRHQYVDCFIKHFGPNPGQLHGYPGHPELELAVLRLYSVTKDPKHLAFGTYLISDRGVPHEEQGGKSYFIYEAEQRKDQVCPHTMDSLLDQRCVRDTRPATDYNTATTNLMSLSTNKMPSLAIRSEPSTSPRRRLTWEGNTSRMLSDYGRMRSTTRCMPRAVSELSQEWVHSFDLS